ncbi:MAG TPA: hypothetical protein VFA18_15960, partial [Gemmataceae bacterium]|nr:hypothetical protein [Gemmataceae bacterium]
TPAVRPWDLTTGREMARLNPYRGSAVWAGFLAGGRSLAVAGTFGELGIWDSATGQALAILPRTESTAFTTWSLARDRRHVVGTHTTYQLIVGHRKLDDGRILLWNPNGNIGPVALRGQVAPAWDAALTPDGRFIVATEATGQIRVYDRRTGKPVRFFAGRIRESCPVISPDGARLATLAPTGTVRIYDFSTGQILHVLKGPSAARCLTISPDSRMLASTHSTETFGPREPSDMICLWDLASGRKLRQILVPRIWAAEHLVFSPDSRLLVSGDMRDVHLWEAASGHERRRYKNDLGQVVSVDFASDGQRIVSTYTSGTALVWRIFDPAISHASGAQLETRWFELARDGFRAHRAIGELTAAHGAVQFLSAHLKPVAQPSKSQWHEWLTQLGSKSFSKRQAAERELARVSEMLEPELILALSTTSDAEVRRRLARVLLKVDSVETRPEELRELRALEVLEHIGTAEARHVLQKLTQGAPNARLTRDAKATLARLTRRLQNGVTSHSR